MGEVGAVRQGVRVRGIVQGVGFRPFVHALASDLGLVGSVGNDAGGVSIEVQGAAASVRAFTDRLSREAPPLAVIEDVAVRVLPPVPTTGFAILASATGGPRGAAIPPDVATCDACLRELHDPGDRRHHYPFLNCTHCGPRFTIVRDVPYDRPATTMADFPLCADCEREYHDPTDRRFHAQPVCCPACGPRLALVAPGGDTLATGDVALEEAVARLRAGEVVAVKGLGGYHLAADARDPAAVATLRARKHREDKPFAVMVASLEDAAELAELDAAAAALLTDRARPIVLLPRRPGADLADAVAPGHRSLGIVLAYTPLHHLLLAGVGRPLVMTSGNVSDEPIAHRDDDALDRLGPIADVLLTSDRPIHVRTDDSIARVLGGRPMLLRRARGYTPTALRLPTAVPRPVLGLGAELKNTICLAAGHRAVLSPHIGDLENYATFTAFLGHIDHLQRLLDITPAVLAHDLHPEYLSTKHAADLAGELGLERVAVQHHHAHIASCLVDNGREGPTIGVALDGTGYGPDGTIWGGEFLVADLVGAERLGHLLPVVMPGGSAAIREPWRMAAAYLTAAFDGDVPEDLPVRRRNAERWAPVLAGAAAGINAPLTSSAGRLFDAVAAVLGVRDTVTYEAQAAIELEQLADPGDHAGYPVPVRDGPPWVVDGPALVRTVVEDLARGTEPSLVAARFHASMAEVAAIVCSRIRDRTGLGQVALSGGVLQNALLVRRLVAALDRDGFDVLLHGRVPPNDGGISLGQVAVAGARERGGTTDRDTLVPTPGSR